MNAKRMKLHLDHPLQELTPSVKLTGHLPSPIQAREELRHLKLEKILTNQEVKSFNKALAIKANWGRSSSYVYAPSDYVVNKTEKFKPRARFTLDYVNGIAMLIISKDTMDLHTEETFTLLTTLELFISYGNYT